MKVKASTRTTNRGKDRQPEAAKSENLKLVMQATDAIPFSFTMFFTDEHGDSIKYGRFVKRQVEANQ